MADYLPASPLLHYKFIRPKHAHKIITHLYPHLCHHLCPEDEMAQTGQALGGVAWRRTHGTRRCINAG